MRKRKIRKIAVLAILAIAVGIIGTKTAEAHEASMAEYRNLVMDLPDDDMGKIEAINDTVCRLLSYDHTLSVYDADEALQKGTGTCEAYANLFHRIATAYGMTDRVVYGTAENNGRTGNRAWNATKVDGKWVYTDTTWNDCAGENLFLGSTDPLKDHAMNGYEVHIFGKTYGHKIFR